MTIRSIAPKPQTVTVRAGDQVLGKVTLDDQSWVTDEARAPAATESRRALGGGERRSAVAAAQATARMLGVQTRDVMFSPVNLLYCRR